MRYYILVIVFYSPCDTMVDVKEYLDIFKGFGDTASDRTAIVDNNSPRQVYPEQFIAPFEVLQHLCDQSACVGL